MSGLRPLLRPLARRLWFVRPRYFPFQAKYRRVHAPPRLVEIVGMPRTGSTLAKRFLGDYPGLVVAEYGGYHKARQHAESLEPGQVLLDKRTRNFFLLDELYRELGNTAWYLGVVRDPRDQLASLFAGAHFHPEIPRDPSFWALWADRYTTLFDLAARRSPHGARFAIVRYEDMTTGPVAVKSAFVAWLGVVGRFEITDEYDTQIEALSRPGREDPRVHQQRRVSAASVGKWLDLEGEQRVLADAWRANPAAARLMERLGYAGESRTACSELPGLTSLV